MNDEPRPIPIRRTDIVGLATIETAQVLTYPQALLALARKLINEGQFVLAIIVCHMACEVATEAALSALGAVLNGYNLANRSNRKRYTALTGDHIEHQHFWPKFTASVTRRNDIVHGRRLAGQVPQGDAEESFKAASDLVAHLKQ